MTKSVTLTLGERVAAVGLLNIGKFNNSTLAVILDDIKKVAVTPEDWTAANLVKTPTDEEIAALPAEEKATARQSWKWDENEKTEKTIELEQGTVDALTEMIKEKSDAKELTLADGAMVTLQKKLIA